MEANVASTSTSCIALAPVFCLQHGRCTSIGDFPCHPMSRKPRADAENRYDAYVEPHNITTAMEHRPKLYATTGFIAGILLTLGFKEFYPDLERRFRLRHAANKTVAGTGVRDDDDKYPIDLEDHTKLASAKHEGAVDVAEGIEACVGNTPLFRIRSLSEATGSEIIAKAEVLISLLALEAYGNFLMEVLVSEWRWWQPKGQSSIEHHTFGKPDMLNVQRMESEILCRLRSKDS